MSRKWYKTIPPKMIQEKLGLYAGIWMPQLDRSWESDDGYSVMSRQIKTEWGIVEHITIVGHANKGDVPWSVKQEIKNELFGGDRTAIEVFPTVKKLVDVCDVYHLWLLPKKFELPFGLHPNRDPQCAPVWRGFDFDVQKVKEWIDSPERKALYETEEIHTLRTQKI